MASTRTYNRSFAGGELSPEMFGRIDDSKFQSGAGLLRNFIATPQGPIENRAGFAYVNTTKNNGVARLIPFAYSTDQTMVIEVGAGYFRFHTQGATLLAGSPAAYDNAHAYVIGDMCTSGGTVYYCIAATTGNAPPNAAFWYAMPSTAYEIPNSYASADLFDIHYVQSQDVLTLVHPNYPPAELSRLGATDWTFLPVDFSPSISTPTGPAVTASPGYKTGVSSITTANPAVFTTTSNHTLSLGDPIYIKGLTATIGGLPVVLDGFYLVNKVPVDGTGAFIPNELQVMDYDGNVMDSSTWTAYTPGATIQYGSKIFDINNYYVVTALAANGVDESQQSAEVSVINNLNVTGSYNEITWTAVAAASRYRVYKKRNGLYGFIGETTATSFVDNNISPDMGITPPIYETVFGGANDYPGAVGYVEQRRSFAGTLNKPQNMWMSKTATESDFSYSLPTKDTDRIAFQIAARERSTIRHIVPLTQAILLTSSTEVRVSPVNSDVLTPTTVSSKPQSYVGASNVQPDVINNSLVYCAARGGHVRELGYQWQANGFVTGDLSLRAAHLFDNLNIVDQCFSKAPRPIVWFVSSSGNLLGLTYIPEEQLGAWHHHDTDGVFESIASVAEGSEDRLYAIIRRTVNGFTVRYVERMASRLIDETDFTTWFFVDAGGTFDGRNTTATTLTINTPHPLELDALVTLVSSAPIFAFPAQTDVGDVLEVTDNLGFKYRITVTGTQSTTTAGGTVNMVTWPATLRPFTTTTWGWARRTISGLSWLEGKSVSILADGAVYPAKTVTGGAITLDWPAQFVVVGLPITMDLNTLPLTMMIDGYGQGRAKNINRAWLRVFRSSGIFVGPDLNHLTEYKQRTTEPMGSPPALQSAEIGPLVTEPSWQQSGQIYVRQSAPLPLTISGLTLEVSIGG